MTMQVKNLRFLLTQMRGNRDNIKSGENCPDTYHYEICSHLCYIMSIMYREWSWIVSCLGGITVKGKITRIIENEYGNKYGFIVADKDYYFDDRYISTGSMSDLYEDDTVEFMPYENPHTGKAVAKNVHIDLGEIKKKEFVPIGHITDKADEEYIIPNQEDSISLNWYNPGRPEKLSLYEFSEEEVAIMNKLSTVLYHTNAGHFKTRQKGIKYGYALLGPTKQFHIRLGLEKVEFVAIFCDQDTFQRRTLEETFLYLT